MVDYPKNCLRGIHKLSDITLDGDVGATVFYPYEKTVIDRTDHYMETSINWEDDDRALSFTLKSFQNGVVRLDRNEIDYIISKPEYFQKVGYERSQESNNPYHGNILFRDDLPKHKWKLIAATLALYSSKVITKP